MGYEMTRPAQKWLGIGSVLGAFVIMLFTLAVPYVNHFGNETNNYTFFTKWNGKWREGQMTTYNNNDLLLDFPKSAPILIGVGLLIILIGAGYLFWLTYSNKSCYILRERPGPVSGIIMIIGLVLYFTGSFIYEGWASGSPRPASGWPADNNFIVETVRISPTFWLGIALGLIIMFFAVTNILYYLDTHSKRPVK
ncbi:MAG TPA: hypothetical protein VMZ29_06850 [Candidatus Bathyarchaeia archaeon]|nr:hypothetical protein [Candidatus Bathyarchaeia archaeon]